MKKFCGALICFLMMISSVWAGEIVFNSLDTYIATPLALPSSVALQNSRRNLVIKNDNNGNVYSGWLRTYDLVAGGTSSTSYEDIIVNVSHDYGVTWNTQDIKLHKVPVINGFSMQMGIDMNGHVYVSWISFEGGMYKVYFTSSKDFGTTWKTPVVVAKQTAGNSVHSMVNDNRGNIYIAWQDCVNKKYKVYLNVSNNFGDTWLSSPKQIVSTSKIIGPYSVKAVCNDSNYVHVLWLDAFHYGNQEGYFYVSSSSNKGISWKAAKKLSFSPRYYSFRFASIYCDSTTGVYVVMQDWAPSIHFSRSKDGGKKWATYSSVLNISQLGAVSFANDHQGRLYFAFTRKDYNSGSNQVKFKYSLDYGTTWSAESDLNMLLGAPKVGVNSNGKIYVTGSNYNFSEMQYSADYGRTWSDKVKVNNTSTGSYEWPFSVDKDGNVIAVWWSDIGVGVNFAYTAGEKAYVPKSVVLPKGKLIMSNGKK